MPRTLMIKRHQPPAVAADKGSDYEVHPSITSAVNGRQMYGYSVNREAEGTHGQVCGGLSEGKYKHTQKVSRDLSDNIHNIKMESRRLFLDTENPNRNEFNQSGVLDLVNYGKRKIVSPLKERQNYAVANYFSDDFQENQVKPTLKHTPKKQPKVGLDVENTPPRLKEHRSRHTEQNSGHHHQTVRHTVSRLQFTDKNSTFLVSSTQRNGFQPSPCRHVPVTDNTVLNLSNKTGNSAITHSPGLDSIPAPQRVQFHLDTPIPDTMNSNSNQGVLIHKDLNPNPRNDSINNYNRNMGTSSLEIKEPQFHTANFSHPLHVQVDTKMIFPGMNEQHSSISVRMEDDKENVGAKDNLKNVSLINLIKRNQDEDRPSSANARISQSTPTYVHDDLNKQEQRSFHGRSKTHYVQPTGESKFEAIFRINRILPIQF